MKNLYQNGVITDPIYYTLIPIRKSVSKKIIKKELSNPGEQEKMVDGLIDDIKLN